MTLPTATRALAALLAILPVEALALDEGQPAPVAAFEQGTLGGKVVLLEFWVSWCPACRRTLPYLRNLSRRYESDEFEVVTVNLDKEERKAAPYYPLLGDDVKVIRDPQGEIARRFGVSSVPTAFLIDRKGVVSAVRTRLHSDHREIEGLIEGELREEH